MLYDLRKAVRRLWLLLERYGVSVAGADAAAERSSTMSTIADIFRTIRKTGALQRLDDGNRLSHGCFTMYTTLRHYLAAPTSLRRNASESPYQHNRLGKHQLLLPSASKPHPSR